MKPSIIRLVQAICCLTVVFRIWKFIGIHGILPDPYEDTQAFAVDVTLLLVSINFLVGGLSTLAEDDSHSQKPYGLPMDNRSWKLPLYFRKDIGFILGAGTLYSVIVGFGAALTTKCVETLCAAIALSSLTVLPWLEAEQVRPGGLQRVLGEGKPRGQIELGRCMSTGGALLGAWIGGFVVPLDWQEPWQAWPLPVLYGTTLGNLVGSALAAFDATVLEDQHKTS